MTNYASRRPNLFPPLTKNIEKTATLKLPTFKAIRKNFYTVPALVENSIFLSKKSMAYKSAI
jgi:hypothetical protein